MHRIRPRYGHALRTNRNQLGRLRSRHRQRLPLPRLRVRPGGVRVWLCRRGRGGRVPVRSPGLCVQRLCLVLQGLRAAWVGAARGLPVMRWVARGAAAVLTRSNMCGSATAYLTHVAVLQPWPCYGLPDTCGCATALAMLQGVVYHPGGHGGPKDQLAGACYSLLQGQKQQLPVGCVLGGRGGQQRAACSPQALFYYLAQAQ